MNEKITPELMKQAETAGSPEEILVLAKEHGMELTPEEAQAYYDRFHKTGELADDELDAVSGGGCHRPDGRLVVSNNYSCQHWKCAWCHQGKEANHDHGEDGVISQKCQFCYWRQVEGMNVCGNPKNKK